MTERQQISRESFGAGVAIVSELLQAQIWSEQALEAAYHMISPYFDEPGWRKCIEQVCRRSRAFGGRMPAPADFLEFSWYWRQGYTPPWLEQDPNENRKLLADSYD